MNYNPWDVIRDHRSWTLDTYATLPAGEMGRWYNGVEVMLIERSLTQVTRRCTAAHEVEHALAGDEGCSAIENEDYFTCKMERRAHSRAARKLVPVDALIEALRLYEGDDAKVRDHLGIDQDVLDIRRETLQPDERHRIRIAMNDAGSLLEEGA